MYAFEYHRPTSVKEAAGLAGQAEDTKFLAGGHTLLPTMKLRLAGPANLIDLGQIAELRGIEDQAIAHYQVTLKVGFTLEGS